MSMCHFLADTAVFGYVITRLFDCEMSLMYHMFQIELSRHTLCHTPMKCMLHRCLLL